ncbi:MAG: hypothetical protein ABEI06_08770 [Halobacteriaceae archaeon]
MSSASSEYDIIDEAALITGFGLVLFGSAVIGFFETLFGSTHFTHRISGAGKVVVHVSFSPHLRAYIIAGGFLILFGWGISRVGRAIIA